MSDVLEYRPRRPSTRQVRAYWGLRDLMRRIVLVDKSGDYTLKRSLGIVVYGLYPKIDLIKHIWLNDCRANRRWCHLNDNGHDVRRLDFRVLQARSRALGIGVD